MNNLKTKLDDLDVGTLKTVPVGLKKAVKNTKFNTLETKLNNLDKKNFWCNYINSHKPIQQR